VLTNEASDPYSQIAHCLIYRQDGHYGFAEPYFIHLTLKDLVLHYRETSLFEHNDEMDITLRTPIGMVDLPSNNTRSPVSAQQVCKHGDLILRGGGMNTHVDSGKSLSIVHAPCQLISASLVLTLAKTGKHP